MNGTPSILTVLVSNIFLKAFFFSISFIVGWYTHPRWFCVLEWTVSRRLISLKRKSYLIFLVSAAFYRGVCSYESIHPKIFIHRLLRGLNVLIPSIICSVGVYIPSSTYLSAVTLRTALIRHILWHSNGGWTRKMLLDSPKKVDICSEIDCYSRRIEFDVKIEIS